MMFRDHLKTATCAGIFGLQLFSQNVLGEVQSGGSAVEINQLKQLLMQQSKQLADQQHALAEQNQQLSEMKSRLDAISSPQSRKKNGSKSASKRGSAETPEQPTIVAQATPSPVLAPLAAKQDSQVKPQAPRLREMPKSNRPPEIPRIAPDIGGVLTPKGRFVIEPSVQYAYSKATRVAIQGYSIVPALTIGVVDVRDVKRETEVVALTGRYGLTERIELEARVPYVHRQDTTQTRQFLTPNTNDTFFNASGTDLGDIEVAGRYQINDGKKGWPFFIGNLRVKTVTGKDPFETPIDPKYNIPTELATGTGFWSIQPSLTAIYPSDPVVFYGNTSYLFNMERDIGGQRLYTTALGKAPTTRPVGLVDPGDAIGFSFGMSLAVNEKASFSLGYSHNIYFKTEQTSDVYKTLKNGKKINTGQKVTEKINGSDFDVGQFVLGFNYAFTKKTSANVAVAIGATRDAPDVQMTLRVPMGFDI